MKYYYLTVQSRALCKGEMVEVPGVSGERPNGELKKQIEAINAKEFPDNLPMLSPLFPEGYGPKHTWERFHFDVNCFILNSSHIIGLVVNQKVKDIFEKLNIPSEHRYYPAEFFFKNEMYPKYIFVWKYYQPSPEEVKQNEWMLVVSDGTNTTYSRPYDGEAITDLKHFQKVVASIYGKTGEELVPAKLVFETDFDFAQFPFFIGFGTVMHTVVSQRFKNKIEAEGITGLEFKPVYYKIAINKK
jgi:hypothetical protein